MKILYTQTEFSQARSKDLLKLECEYCSKPFFRYKANIKQALDLTNPKQCKYCSRACQHLSRIKKKEYSCFNCGKPVFRQPCEINHIKNKHNRAFCNQSCSAIYNNAHKSHGTTVSKLELWLQSQLSILYPELEILYNDKTTINSELDIYIPSLKLAFELNGIFHYEPIYGQETLDRIQNNDDRKFQACIERGIKLCIIDSSGQKRFTEKSSIPFLSIITNIISNQ